MFQQQQQQLAEKQRQQASLAPAGPSHISRDAQSQPSGATPQSHKRFQNPPEQDQPLEDPEGELT